MPSCPRGGTQTTTANEGAPAVHTGKTVRWRLASSFPRSLDTIFGAAEFMAERVKAMTGGSFDIRVYPGGELVPGLAVLDAVQNETVQIGQTCSYYYTGKNPALAFDTCVPFGMTARQQQAWLGEGGGGGSWPRSFRLRHSLVSERQYRGSDGRLVQGGVVGLDGSRVSRCGSRVSAVTS